MTKTVVVYMGGTFGCVGEPLAPMPASDFLPHLQRQLDASVQCVAAPSIQDSSAFSTTDWLKLAQFLQHLMAQGVTHVLLIHGTDTLSYVAALLTRLLGQSVHLIVTGSQLPLLDVHGMLLRKHSDAWDNLQFALAQLKQVTAGCYVAFAGQLFYGRNSLKIHRNALHAFAGLAVDHTKPDDTFPIPTTRFICEQNIERSRQLKLCNIMLQPVTSVVLAQQILALAASAPDFLILQAYGCGNIALDHTLSQALEHLQSQNCLCILSSQVPFGQLQNLYAINTELAQTGLVLNHSHSAADLYAKIVQLYLQYHSAAEWRQHWYAYD